MSSNPPVPINIDAEGKVLVIPSVGTIAPVGDLTPGDVAALITRIEASENLGFVDLNDVEMIGVADGQVFAWDAATQHLVPITPGAPLAVDQGGETTRVANVDLASFRDGFQVLPHSTIAGVVIITPIYGGTGTSDTIARADHTHKIRADVPFRYGASGTLSSGTRTLTSGNVTGLDPGRSYVITAHLSGDLRGEGTGAGYTMPRIVLNGNTRDRYGQVRTVSGVDRSFDMHHPGVVVTSVSSITATATLQYNEGDPINVGAGELVVSIDANR